MASFPSQHSLPFVRSDRGGLGDLANSFRLVVSSAWWPVPSDQALFNELSYYTLSHRDPRFIHQHVVDAYAAQHADDQTKPIKVVFSLVGLCLFLEKNFTGRQVQQMHMRLAKRRKQWPRLPLPSGPRGVVTVSTVMAAPSGPARDEMVRAWCASVWQTWQDSRPQILNLLKQELDIN